MRLLASSTAHLGRRMAIPTLLLGVVAVGLGVVVIAGGFCRRHGVAEGSEQAGRYSRQETKIEWVKYLATRLSMQYGTVTIVDRQRQVVTLWEEHEEENGRPRGMGNFRAVDDTR